MIAQVLLLAGAGIFFVLGAAHGILALRDLSHPRTFTPTDEGVRYSMQRSTVAISQRSNLWNAWIGFNLSHSLGLILFGGSMMVIAWRHFPVFAQSPLMNIMVLVVAATYLILSMRFFFRAPTLAAGVGFLSFLGAVIIVVS